MTTVTTGAIDLCASSVRAAATATLRRAGRCDAIAIDEELAVDSFLKIGKAATRRT